MPDRSAHAIRAFEGRRWAEVHRLLSDQPAAEATVGDLDRLAVASYLMGRDDEAVRTWERAHRRGIDDADHAAAAQCAFWAAFCLMMRGDMAQAGAWLQRAEVTIGDRDCAASGYLLIPQVLGAIDAGDGSTARTLATRVGDVADRFHDQDLAALSMLGEGQALLVLGDHHRGVARLDEVMLSVRSGEVGPIISGIVYCAVVLECIETYDFGRAAEWTTALDAWCETQPELVPYRGQCLIHQSQLQQLAGDWARAATTVASACARLTDPPHPALGLACYQQGELLRLRGDLAGAADAYGRASRAGYQPMPGLALLQRAQGDGAAAVASIRRALVETTQPYRMPPLLDAAVRIFVDAGDVDAARDAAAELAAAAEQSESPVLRAMADQSTGAVALASGDLAEALPCLRSAREAWHRLQMPYEAARVAVLLGRGYEAFGDRPSAQLEFDHARETFTVLEARTDLDGLAALAGRAPNGTESLSSREVEVLAKVAAGGTNREIAGDLSISPHTVGRHLENIFAKIGVSSRAAATAWAYEHDLL